MARAYGSSAHLLMKRETVYGQAATGNYLACRSTAGSVIEVRTITKPVAGTVKVYLDSIEQLSAGRSIRRPGSSSSVRLLLWASR
jgi:hypothetical protein